MKKSFLILTLAFLAVSISCKKEKIEPETHPTHHSDTTATDTTQNDTTITDTTEVSFFVQDTLEIFHKEEKMPLWVYGESSSDVIILIVHGGPGDNVKMHRDYKGGLGFRNLEENVLVAYWQQRAAGESTGPDNSNYYSIPQFSQDCDITVDTLRNRYPDKKIVMLGHSWGGMLSAYYLRSSSRREKIAGWINVAGVHNGVNLLERSAEDLLIEADIRIANNENVNYWESLKYYVQQNVYYANSYSYDCVSFIDEVSVKVPISDFQMTDRARNSNSYIFPVLLQTNNNSYLANYTLPTLALWGKYDFSVSKQIRDELLSHSGSKNLVSVEFESSSHFPMFQEPDLFSSTIKNFTDNL